MNGANFLIRRREVNEVVLESSWHERSVYEHDLSADYER